MAYRVESMALPRARTFKDYRKALAFARALASKTTHEVQVVFVSVGWDNHHVVYVFNKKFYDLE